ncbi:type VII secretion integral membrane protein EccD [Mycobacterium simiae]|uniref:type VII secretion integral membrane protein EccD n=1 Tax=Mycobacterium simiae TaxID=1784 RepID=UPI002612E5DB|nr:type VII secretion integral membrane protein EccD [Mycobacterium simiae]
MSVSDPGLRRVSVHAGSAVVDVALPSAIPIAALVPPIVDILTAQGINELPGRRDRLAVPGAAALDPSKTLLQNGIHDGDVLVLTTSEPPPPTVRYHDVADAVAELRCDGNSAPSPRMRLTVAICAAGLTGTGILLLVVNTLNNNAFGFHGMTAVSAALVAVIAVAAAVIAQRANRGAMAGLTLSLIGIAWAATAGFLGVPGAPGVPNVLLAATAAMVAAVLTMRVGAGAVVTLTAVSCFSAVVAAAALGGVVTGAPTHAVGAAATAVSLGLLATSGRAAIALAGLSPHRPPSADTELRLAVGRADGWLASLRAAFSAATALGAVVTVLAGAPRLDCLALATAAGVLLLLRAASASGGSSLVCAVGATVTISTTFACTTIRLSGHGPWLVAATALLGAAACYLGFVAPHRPLPALARKAVELFECVVLIGTVPLACWICGCYDTARGLQLRWG